jgi:hypothetical protein
MSRLRPASRGKRPVSPVGPLPLIRSHPSGRDERRPHMSGAAAKTRHPAREVG